MRLLATLQILVTAIGLGAGAALWLLGPRGAVPADRAPLLISLAVGCGLLALVGSVMLRDRRVVAIGTVVLALLAATSAGLFGWLLSRGVGDPVQSWTEPADEGAALERVRVVWLDLAAEKPSRSDTIRREDRRVDWAWDRGVDLLRSPQADVDVLRSM